MTNYLAISIKEPHAKLILDELKSIETRSWHTNIREKIVIHTSKMHDKFALESLGINPNSIVNGCLVGFVEITDSFLFDDEAHFKSLQDKHRSPYEYYEGIRGWSLKNAVRFDPIPYKGHLGFFNVDIPF